jgi:hypothetical protein
MRSHDRGSTRPGACSKRVNAKETPPLHQPDGLRAGNPIASSSGVSLDAFRGASTRRRFARAAGQQDLQCVQNLLHPARCSGRFNGCSFQRCVGSRADYCHRFSDWALKCKTKVRASLAGFEDKRNHVRPAARSSVGMPASVEFQDAQARPNTGSATKHDPSPGAATAVQQ